VEANSTIAEQMGLNKAAAGIWRKRYFEQGIEGLPDELRSGRPRRHDDERFAEVINTALQTQPVDGSYWSVRTLAEQTGVSTITVQRWFELFGIPPLRQRNLKPSNDPFFNKKVLNVPGLYLNPLNHAVMLCVDEKTQVQALNRTQPKLPVGLDYVEEVTHDDVRHGATAQFAAVDVATGQVFRHCKSRHRHQDFLAFLRHIDANVPAQFDVHFVVDNCATHMHPKVKVSLVRRPRYRIHFTPPYASWVNQVERWFGNITQKAIPRGSFSSVKEFVAKIEHFLEHYNANSRPFVWTATSESVLANIERLCSAISGTAY
jgi:putative transposase